MKDSQKKTFGEVLAGDESYAEFFPSEYILIQGAILEAPDIAFAIGIGRKNMLSLL